MRFFSARSNPPRHKYRACRVFSVGKSKAFGNKRISRGIYGTYIFTIHIPCLDIVLFVYYYAGTTFQQSRNIRALRVEASRIFMGDPPQNPNNIFLILDFDILVDSYNARENPFHAELKLVC